MWFILIFFYQLNSTMGSYSVTSRYNKVWRGGSLDPNVCKTSGNRRHLAIVWNKGTALYANTANIYFFQICIRFDSSLFTNTVCLMFWVSWGHVNCDVVCLQIQDAEWNKTCKKKFAMRCHRTFGCLSMLSVSLQQCKHLMCLLLA